MWCTSVNVRCPQPGKRHPRSRARTARFTRVGIAWVFLPTVAGLPTLSNNTATNGLSQAMRRAVSGESAGPSSSSQRPSVSSVNTSASTWIIARYRSLRAAGPCAKNDSAIATTALAPSGPAAGGSAEPSSGDNPSRAASQRRLDDRDVLGREPHRQHPGAVVIPREHRCSVRVAVSHAAPLLLEVDPAPIRRRDPLQLRPGRVLGEHHQIRFGGRRRDPGDRPHLRITDPPRGELLARSTAGPPKHARPGPCRAPNADQGRSANSTNTHTRYSPTPHRPRGDRTRPPTPTTGTPPPPNGPPAR